MCDFQIDYRFFNSKSSTIKTKKNMKMKCDFNDLGSGGPLYGADAESSVVQCLLWESYHACQVETISLFIR